MDPARYSDEYREELLRIISEKAPVESPEAPDGSQPSTTTARAEDLMEALKQSVEEARAKKADTRDRRRAG